MARPTPVASAARDDANLSGWGRYPVVRCRVRSPADDAELQAAIDAGPVIARGNGRSYGDSAVQPAGTVLTAGLGKTVAFDAASGEVICDSGALLADVLEVAVPRGWFLPVTPGTKFVSVGGAIAADVHGKNHHRVGSFGAHVLWLDLMLADGRTLRCSPTVLPDLFAATIGGMGLTGVIRRAAIRLIPIETAYVRRETVAAPNLDATLEAFEGSGDWTYTVAWIDSSAGGARLGRSLLHRGEHATVAELSPAAQAAPLTLPAKRSFRVPIDPPSWLLNGLTTRLLNAAYWERNRRRTASCLVDYDSFFYPLDGLLDWNRLYGRKGFLQYQCVLPLAASRAGLKRILSAIQRSGHGSFLSVLKLFGPGRGGLSFPMHGYTLALDFPASERLFGLLDELDAVVLEYGGRLYLAKDARMRATTFTASYPDRPWFDEVRANHGAVGAFSSRQSQRLGLDGCVQDMAQQQAAPGRPALSQVDIGGSMDRQDTLDKPSLLTLDDACAMRNEEVASLFRSHLNPGQYGVLRLLGFHRVTISRAEGMYYYDQDGRAILDFFGGFGSLALGHNHPRLLAARRRFQDERRHEIAIAFMSQYAAALAKNLASIAPADLDMVFFGSTGSEAVEYALKLAEKSRGPKRSRVAYAEKAFHGKSRGALAVTDSPLYRSEFVVPNNTVRVPFGDAAALRAILAADPSIGTLILETVQGGAGIVTAPPAYWREVRAICDEHDVVWIADEVQCGVGRTGRFFAFEHTGVVPDVVTLAKSLGGGKAAVGAVISRRGLFMGAYGSSKTALVHAQATFGGIGESCATAIETLNILYDEGLIENCAKQGARLIGGLRDLAAKYPSIIKEVRGEGLMVGLEFNDFSRTMPFGIRSLVSLADDRLKGSLCGFVGSLLLRDYDILVAFTEYNRNVIRLEPPLIVSEAEVDRFLKALDDLLGRGVARIVQDYVKSFVQAA